MTKLFLTRIIGKNTVYYSTLKKKWMGLFWKTLPRLQALGWEPELCHCGFVKRVTFAITVKICPGLSFKCHKLAFSRET